MLILEMKKGKDGQCFFHIKGKNGRIIAHSEMYRNKAYCLRIINKIAGTAEWKIRVA